MFPWLRHLSAAAKVGRRARGMILRCVIILSGGECGSALQVESGFRLRHGGHNGLKFGRGVYIGKDVTIDCAVGAKLQIGENVTLTQGIFIGLKMAISIGNDVLIGEYCSIRDSNHRIADHDIPIRLQGSLSATVHIADDCWIGRGSCILPGCTLGRGVVVGANSVVNRPFKDMSIVAGAPARVIGSRLPPDAI